MNNDEKIVIELEPKTAPNTVASIISLIEDGFYDGLIFHRVILSNEILNRVKTIACLNPVFVFNFLVFLLFVQNIGVVDMYKSLLPNGIVYLPSYLELQY